MSVIVQVDFPFEGPWGEDAVNAMRDLAQSIAQEPGLVWKIWTENAETKEAGGIYLFKDRASADAYVTMHTARLQSFGIQNIRAKVLDVNAGLSAIDRAPLS